MSGGFKDTIFITGGAGFIGSNYLNTYVPRMKKRLFVNLDCLTYAGDLSNITVAAAKNYVFEKVDLRDKKKLETIFKKYKPSGVINFAAETHVDESIKAPGVFIETNVEGTHNLLTLSRHYGVRRFHQISTDEVYGALQSRKGSFSESAPLAPRNPYSASKAAADLLVLAYRETFGMDVVITRSCNVFGPNQDVSKIIPSFITKLLRGKKVPLYSRGQHIREWIYVKDCVEAIHVVFQRGKAGAVYNISGGYELTNRALTDKLLALALRDASSIEFVPDRPGHDFRYALDTRKIRREIGWEPSTSFKDGLRATFDFYKSRTQK